MVLFFRSSPTQILIPRLVSPLSLLSYIWALEVMSKKHEHWTRVCMIGQSCTWGRYLCTQWVTIFFRWGRHPASVSHSCSLMLGWHASCPIIPVVQRLITYTTPLPSKLCTGITDWNILVFLDSYWRVMWPEHFIHPLLQSVCGTYRLCGIHRTSLGSVCDI